MALATVVLSILVQLAVSTDGGDEILGCAGFAKISRSMRNYLSKEGKGQGVAAASKIDYSDVTVGLAIKISNFANLALLFLYGATH